MSKQFDRTENLRQADLSGFSPALLLQVQKYVPTSIIQEVWQKTGGDRDLTQSILNLILKRYLDKEYSPTNITIDRQQELDWLEAFIESAIVPRWENISELSSLRDIAVCLLNNPNVEPFWLLKEYQKIWREKKLLFNNSEEQQELLALELVVLKDGFLRVRNSIYESVFNEVWIEDKLTDLSPYQLILSRLSAKCEAPDRILEEILLRTNQDLYLTKIICNLVWQFSENILLGEEKEKVSKIIKDRLTSEWEKNSASSYLISLGDRLIKADDNGELKLLKLYRQVLIEPGLLADFSADRQELLQLGLVNLEAGKLFVSNSIYREIFDLDWVERELAKKVDRGLVNSDNNKQAISANSSLQNLNLFTINLIFTLSLGTTLFLYLGNRIFNSPNFQPNIEQNN